MPECILIQKASWPIHSVQEGGVVIPADPSRVVDEMTKSRGAPPDMGS